MEGTKLLSQARSLFALLRHLICIETCVSQLFWMWVFESDWFKTWSDWFGQRGGLREGNVSQLGSALRRSETRSMTPEQHISPHSCSTPPVLSTREGIWGWQYFTPAGQQDIWKCSLYSFLILIHKLYMYFSRHISLASQNWGVMLTLYKTHLPSSGSGRQLSGEVGMRDHL